MLFTKKPFIENIKKQFTEYSLTIDSYVISQTKGVWRLKITDANTGTEYISIFAANTLGKEAEKSWQDVLEHDLLKALIECDKAGFLLPAMLIVPQQDIDIVKEIAITKKIDITTFTLIEGYNIFALKRSDCANFLRREFEPINPADGDEASAKLSPEERFAEHNENRFEKKVEIITNELIKKMSKPINPIVNKIFIAALIGITLALGTMLIYILFGETETIKSTYEDHMAQTKTKFISEIKTGRTENIELKKVLLTHPLVSKAILTNIKTTEELYEAVKNTAAPSYILKSALTSNDQFLRAQLALNQNLPPEYYSKLMTDSSEYVRANLASNPSITRNIMTRLAKDTPIVRSGLLENSQLSSELFDLAAVNMSPSCEFNIKLFSASSVMITRLRTNEAHTDPCVRTGVAKNINTPTDIINRYTKDTNTLVRREALMNQNISEDILREYFNRPLSLAPEDNLLDRLAILSNPKTPKDILEQALLNDPYTYGVAVAKNIATPKELINTLEQFAISKGGMDKFLAGALNISTDYEALLAISTSMRQSKNTLAKPLKQYINKLFIDNVYDPNILNDYMQRYINYASSQTIKRLTDKNMGKDKIRFNDNNISLSDITNPFALPVNFTDTNELRNIVKSSNFATTTDVAIVLADNIVYATFRTILPDVEKAMITNGLAEEQELASVMFNDEFDTKTVEEMYKNFSKMTDEMNKYFDQQGRL